jgi:GDP-4-dehydro-6-deoxy-D-mannose reductase
MTRILVTGATGFVGRHLLDLLRSEPDLRIAGTSRHAFSLKWPERTVSTYVGDLTDRAFTDGMISEVRPDLVVHLAAQSSVSDSWQDPQATLVNNLVAQLNVLRSLTVHAPRSRVLVTGSSQEYGAVAPHELPLTEDAPLRPDSPYALSKVIQDFLGLQYFLGYGLGVIRVRAFNLIGPGQGDRFAIPSFARQIAEAEVGLRPRLIRVGNLEPRRDFTDVRDAVRAYWGLLRQGAVGEVYNVGGGSNRSIRDALDTLISLARVPVDVQVDPALLRPSDVPVVECDTHRLQSTLSWRPTISFEQSLRDILEEWRQKIADRSGQAGD